MNNSEENLKLYSCMNSYFIRQNRNIIVKTWIKFLKYFIWLPWALPDGMWTPPELRLNPRPALTGFLITGSPRRFRIFLNETENCLVFLLLYSLHGENFSCISPLGRNILFSFKVLPLFESWKAVFSMCINWWIYLF